MSSGWLKNTTDPSRWQVGSGKLGKSRGGADAPLTIRSTTSSWTWSAPAVTTDRISDYLTQFSQTRTQMVEQLGRVIVGQNEVIEQILAAIFTRGHCLLVGVPGLAKTLMVSSMAQILDVTFK